jgi:hypothetical protein
MIVVFRRNVDIAVQVGSKDLIEVLRDKAEAC